METAVRPFESMFEIRKRFLNAYSLCGTIYGACQVTGIERRSIYEWRASDPQFIAEMEKATEQAVDVLEEETRRRGYLGWEEAVYFKGEVVGWNRKYSDGLLMFRLRMLAPEKYRERVDTRHSMSGPTDLPADTLSVDAAAKLREAYLALQSDDSAVEAGQPSPPSDDPPS